MGAGVARWLTRALIVALFVLWCPELLARAGGGSSFGRKSSSRSYSSSRSSSSSRSYGLGRSSSGSRSYSSSRSSSSSRSYSSGRLFSSGIRTSSSGGRSSGGYSSTRSTDSRSSSGPSSGTAAADAGSDRSADGGGGGVDLVADWFGWAMEWVLRLAVLIVAPVVLWGLYLLGAAAARSAAGREEGSVDERLGDLEREQRALREEQRRIEERLKRLRAEDPNFSRPLFLDFVQLLYTRGVLARATGEVKPVVPYVDEPLILQWSDEACREPRTTAVREIVVGALRIVRLSGLGRDRTRCDVELEATMVEVRPAGEEAIWVKERWTLTRQAQVLSKGPEQIRALNCPSCGAPCECRADGTCTYCDKVVNRGNFHWLVVGAHVLEKGERPGADQLVSGGEEVGTDLPTLKQASFGEARRAFMARYPTFVWDAFVARVRQIFLAVQEAWSTQEWHRARPLETDNLYATHRYWLENYRNAGLRNVLERIAIEKVEAVRFERDAFYESITVRIFASMVDYTVDGAGQVVSGSRSEPRRFSEYWTFIAVIGSDLAARPLAPQCPSCGAALAITQTGTCSHCSALVTSGRYGWVLSMIEQDEAYAG